MAVNPETVNRILTILDELYPWDGRCFLHYEEPWQLLFATILSAQCTDDRVNQVTAVLYKKYPSLESIANAKLLALEKVIHSTGFFRAKARHLQSSARVLLEKHNGQVPSSIEELTALSGVGRKTANVVRGHIFCLPSVVVDTHVMRISKRLGLTKNSDPVKIEFDLMRVLPKSSWIKYNHQIIAFGREICKAPNAKCGQCFMTDICPSFKG